VTSLAGPGLPAETSADQPPIVRTLRADAQRNLDRVLDAACECFAEQGIETSVDEIARRAGVGHGTVFRRFPSKEALLAAVVRRRVLELTVAAESAANEADAGEAFVRFLRGAAETYRRDRALVDGLGSCLGTDEVVAFVSATRRLVRRAQRAGALRCDVTAEDVLALVPAASVHPEVIIDGLRARPGARRAPGAPGT
jgi:AcrR family transcriptional regulator